MLYLEIFKLSLIQKCAAGFDTNKLDVRHDVLNVGNLEEMMIVNHLEKFFHNLNDT